MPQLLQDLPIIVRRSLDVSCNQIPVLKVSNVIFLYTKKNLWHIFDNTAVIRQNVYYLRFKKTLETEDLLQVYLNSSDSAYLKDEYLH